MVPDNLGAASMVAIFLLVDMYGLYSLMSFRFK